MAQFVSNFAEPGDPEYAPPKPEVELPSQKRERIHKLRLEKGVEKAAEDLKKYDPNNDPNATGDPYKTLFVSRLNYESSESKIKREFESYGPIKRVGYSEHSLAGSVRICVMASLSRALCSICFILSTKVFQG
jgi:U1 small nuclear ribonucleoprotein